MSEPTTPVALRPPYLRPGDRVFTLCLPSTKERIYGTVIDITIGCARRGAIAWDGTLTTSYKSGAKINIGLIDESEATFDGGAGFIGRD